jgi:hypothetical protein
VINRILGVFTASIFACAIVIVFAASHASAQEAGVIDISKVPATAANLKSFVPAGWKLEEQIDGDLNGDGIADHAIKLIEDKPAMAKDETMNERGRALVLVFEDKDGKFRNAAVADKLLQCASCGGAFYGVSPAPSNVKIQKGVLVVEQDHGSREVTDVTFRFRYDEQPNSFILIGFDYSSRDRAAGGGASESTNYLTGKRVTTKSKGKKDTTTTSQITKMRYSIHEVDAEKFEEEATKRLGLD